MYISSDYAYPKAFTSFSFIEIEDEISYVYMYINFQKKLSDSCKIMERIQNALYLESIDLV